MSVIFFIISEYMTEVDEIILGSLNKWIKENIEDLIKFEEQALTVLVELIFKA